MCPRHCQRFFNPEPCHFLVMLACGGLAARIVLAQKFFDEICYRSDFYASFNQLSVWQINTLEVEFLCRIHFSLAVFPDQYEAFYNELRNLCSVPSLRERSASSHASCIESVSIPAIVNIAPSGCPLLKYVFTPQEQQRKEAYYRQCEQQRQSMLHRFPPILKPILLVPTLPYPLRHTPAAKDAAPHTRSTEFYYPPPTVCPPPLVPPLPPVANVVSNPTSVVAHPPVFGIPSVEPNAFPVCSGTTVPPIPYTGQVLPIPNTNQVPPIPNTSQILPPPPFCANEYVQRPYYPYGHYPSSH